MNIVRSDENGDTTVVTVREMRAELNAHPDRQQLDPEVAQIDASSVLLCSFDGDTDANDVSFVVGKEGRQITFTIYD
jgi:hypothetical protein